MAKLTLQEKLGIIEKLKAHPRICNLWYDGHLMEDGHNDSIWYDGVVMGFEIKDEKNYPRYTVTIRAIGDVNITDSFGNNTHHGNLLSFLAQHGITNDEEVYKAEMDGKIQIRKNNWFEGEIYDKFDTDVLTKYGDAWTMNTPFYLDGDIVVNFIEELKAIRRGHNNERNTKNN